MTGRATWGHVRNQEILGLTLTQPWAHVVVHHDKRIENRKWAPPAWAIGKRLYEEDTAAELWTKWRVSVPTKRQIPLGAVVGTALLTGYLVGDFGKSYDQKRPCPPDQVRWFFGPYGWLLDEVKALPEPIPCSGALGLWCLPPDVLARLR